MPPIFGRVVPNPHPYDASVAHWLTLDSHHRAMSRNVMHDHRVSMPREETFDVETGFPRDAGQLRDAIEDYLTARVRSALYPDYLNPHLNGANIAPHFGLGSPHKDAMLVRALDLNGLAPLYQWARERHRSPFLGPPVAPDGIAAWLDKKIRGRSNQEVRDFVSGVIGLMNDYLSQVGPYGPVWATMWEELKASVALGPHRWLEMLGVPKETFPRWIILLAYPVREAGTLARPTILDAGWRSCHFPSPPPLRGAPSYCGHPMDLRYRPAASGLISEFVHMPIKHTMQHWLNTSLSAGPVGQYGRTTRAIPTSAIVAQRRAHHALLLSIYGRRVRGWMPAYV
jgi:hypothetical protein